MAVPISVSFIALKLMDLVRKLREEIDAESEFSNVAETAYTFTRIFGVRFCAPRVASKGGLAVAPRFRYRTLATVTF